MYAELVLKSPDDHDGKASKNTTEYAEIIHKPNSDKSNAEQTKWEEK